MHLFLCFAGSWRPQTRSWVAGQTAWSTLNPKNWMNKYTKKMSAEGIRCTTSVGPGEKHLPAGQHGLGGEATTQEQYLRSSLSFKTTQDLKHLNKTNQQAEVVLAGKQRGESLDLCTTSLFLQSLPWVFSFFLVCFSFWGFFVSFFFPNKHAVWLSLSHIGQDIRLCFFFFGFFFFFWKTFLWK